ncbi:hypothetical protein ACE193_17235 [Bernardetia sp. OM2101]|uniref:hypothetical protein n=1 Tax=Bernardetia sp. OM2101 TaxID=3344876 RepID=UPI0035CFF3DF
MSTKEKYLNPFTDFNTAESAKFNKKERIAYEDSLKTYRDIKNVVDTAKEEGKEEGKEIGKEIGKEERNIEIATKLILKGLDLEEIVDITELSIQKLKEIANSLKK